jgi:putative PIN family toxin of toxin-antitoxin system
MKRIVLDTNVLVSALLWGGKPLKVIRTIIKEGWTIVVTEELLAELEKTLHKPKLQQFVIITTKTPVEHIIDLRQIVTLVSPTSIVFQELRDPKDLIVLECALGGLADYIVTGDADLTTLEIFQNIRILTPDKFLMELEQ